ncbi:MAG: hypothetical protein V4722_10715 [Bacteroidota bacterium]
MKFKYFLLASLVFTLFFIAGCKKAVEQKKQDALVDAMVAGTWYVGQYLNGANVLTAEFDGYDFNFKSDYTMVAKKGATSVTGTWSADINTKILSANFTSGNPLSMLNGTWSIYYQDSQGPKMNRFESGVEIKLALKIR